MTIPRCWFLGKDSLKKLNASMNTRGFTLIDTLIAVILMGLIVAIALPPTFGLRSRFAVRHATDGFAAKHALARAVAIRHGGIAELHIDAGAGRYWVEVDTSLAGSGATDTIGTVRDVSTAQVTMTSTLNLMCFDARGLATAAAGCATGDGTLVFSRLDAVDTVSVTALGKVRR